jgi:hypothetical protein
VCANHPPPFHAIPGYYNRRRINTTDTEPKAASWMLSVIETENKRGILLILLILLILMLINNNNKIP